MKKVTAVTWNAGGGEGPTGPNEKETVDLLTRFKDAQADFILLQEAQKPLVRQTLHALDYQYFMARPESIVAWLPDRSWLSVAQHDVVLNPNHVFFRPGSTKPVHIVMAHVIVCNEEGVSLDLGSYHTPSDVQNADPPANRIEALKESMWTMGGTAKESKCDATLFGGDDNVDESKGLGSWDFMKFKATGLRRIEPPESTLGNRKTDGFRVRNLKRAGEGQVLKGPTDHDAYLQPFLLPA